MMPLRRLKGMRDIDRQPLPSRHRRQCSCSLSPKIAAVLVACSAQITLCAASPFGNFKHMITVFDPLIQKDESASSGESL